MNIIGIGHMALRCNHFQETLNFYTNVLGGRKAFDLYDDAGNLCLTYVEIAPGQFVELFPAPYEGDNDQMNRSYVHICLEVDDFPKAVRKLQKNGALVTAGPKGAPAVQEPLEEKEPGQCGSICAFVTDPEGNDVELMQFTANSKQLKGGAVCE